MITVTREGVILRQEELSAAQREQAWTMVFSAFIRAHPEVLDTGGLAEAGAAQPRLCGSIPTPLSICAQD